MNNTEKITTKTTKPNKTTTKTVTRAVVPKQPRHKPVTKSGKPGQLQYKVPECAMHFMTALVNPFDTPAGACLPAELFPMPSAKIKTFTRFKFNLGTSGIGAVWARPTFANDATTLVTTTSASVLASNALFTAATNLNSLVTTQNPYTTSQMTQGVLSVAGRSVAYGLRIKYVGQLMSRNGVAIALEHPDHQDLPGTYTWDQLSSHPYADCRRIGEDEWDSAVCSSGPCTPTEFEFLNGATPMVNTSPLMIAVSGVAGDLYEGEFYHHWESIGSLVVNKTRSHSDPETTGKVLEVTKAAAAIHPISPESGPSILDGFVSTMKESLPSIVGGIANTILPGAGGFVKILMNGLPAPHDPNRYIGTHNSVRLLTGKDW